ncbi:hypothetical protein CPB83DRAFT_847720 [Crepidotus variabilis]|uniref:Uncharacterized protein n=1 Tax=Crepidotus variabilis TaxID=179855 RepID=A0A9P6EM66_9AGAR|nr:hypothetical protein CPB83DRAFT_847720 [Crepidotus variabilis]
MTEYDYSPDAYERYMATQNRIARWTESTQSYPPSDPFMRRTPSGDGRLRMGDGIPGGREHLRSDFRGRAPYHSQGPSPHHSRSSMPNIPIESPQPIRPGSSDISGLRGVNIPPIAGSTHSISRPGSRAQGQIPIASQPSHGLEIPPVPEHYPNSTSIPPIGLMAHSSSHSGLARAASHHSASHGLPPFSSNSIMPMSASSYHSYYHSRPRTPDYSDESYSSGSRSYGSYDSYDSYSRTSSPYYYGNVHPSVTTPTIVQPSRSRPVVVPINGGAGGFVVIPPVGQSVHVVDPRDHHDYRKHGHRDHESFFSKLLSPSKWRKGKRRHHHRRRD